MPDYPEGLGLTGLGVEAGRPLPSSESWPFYTGDSGLPPVRSGKTAAVVFGLAMAACLVFLIVNIPKPAGPGATRATRLDRAAAALADQINTRETFPEGIRKINEFFVQNYKPGGSL